MTREKLSVSRFCFVSGGIGVIFCVADGLAEADGGLVADAAVKGVVAEQVEQAGPEAVFVKEGVAAEADTAHLGQPFFERDGAGVEAVIAEDDTFISIAAGFWGDLDGAKLIPAVY